MIVLAAASTLAVAFGLLQMPFGYYTLLRAVLCLTSAVGFAAARRQMNEPWQWVYGALAVLYNPVLPIHLGAKNLWIGVNLLTLVVIWFGVPRFRGVMTGTR